MNRARDCNRPESMPGGKVSNPERACPLCGGTVVETRASRRCTRCAYTVCDGCESGPPDGELNEH